MRNCLTHSLGPSKNWHAVKVENQFRPIFRNIVNASVSILPAGSLSHRFSKFLFFIAGVCLMQTIAGAQTTDQPSAESFAISPGGVDMRTGRYVLKRTDLSAGESDEIGGLALTRLPTTSVAGHFDPFGNLTHNWDIFLIEKSVNLLEGNFDAGSGTDTHVQVVFGTRSETFIKQSNLTQFEQTSRANRATLLHSRPSDSTDSRYVMIAADGTAIVFMTESSSSGCSTVQKCIFASNIIFSDGTEIN